MPLEVAAMSYAGLSCWALSTSRLRRDLQLRLPAGGWMRGLGGALLAFAAWLAIRRFGPAQGPVAWFGMVSVAGLTLLLLLSRWPRFAVRLGMAAMPLGAFILVFGA